jgi:hypothetical protein
MKQELRNRNSVKFTDQLIRFLNSFTPYSNTGTFIEQQKKKFAEMQESKNLSTFSKGVFELSKHAGMELICNFDETSESVTPITFKVLGQTYEIGTFYLGKRPEKITDIEVFRNGSNIGIQNFRGEANSSNESVELLIQGFDEMIKSDPDSIILPAFYPHPKLINHINNLGYNLIFTRITVTPDGNEKLGNATAIKSGIKVKELRLSVSCQGQVPYWHWEKNGLDLDDSTFRPNVYSNQILIFENSRAIVNTYLSSFSSVEHRIVDFINILKSLKDCEYVFAAGDFNSFGKAHNPEDMSIIIDWLGKVLPVLNQGEILPALSWNLPFNLNALTGNGSESEIALLSKIAESFGFELNKQSKPSMMGTKSIFPLFLDLTLTKGIKLNNSPLRLNKFGLDHIGALVEIQELKESHLQKRSSEIKYDKVLLKARMNVYVRALALTAFIVVSSNAQNFKEHFSNLHLTAQENHTQLIKK